MRTVTVRSNGRAICTAEVAESAWARTRGLLGRSGLPDGQGLWIRPCRSIHTLFMRFPIDVVYLSVEGTVVKARPNVKPFRLSHGGRKARSVLELPAGFLARTPLLAGEGLEFVEATGGP